MPQQIGQYLSAQCTLLPDSLQLSCLRVAPEALLFASMASSFNSYEIKWLGDNGLCSFADYDHWQRQWESLHPDDPPDMSDFFESGCSEMDSEAEFMQSAGAWPTPAATPTASQTPARSTTSSPRCSTDGRRAA